MNRTIIVFTAALLLSPLAASAPAASRAGCEVAAQDISLTLSLEGGCRIAGRSQLDRLRYLRAGRSVRGRY